MSGMVSETVFSRIKTEKTFDGLTGMFSDGKLSIDNYLREKHHELDVVEENEDIRFTWIR